MERLPVTLPHPESLVLQPEYDFVIVGSGGGSMVAAIFAKLAGLNPVILEKRDKIGGSTGFSGGVWWVPNNHVIKRFGVADSRELAERYMDATVNFVGKGTSPARREAFLDEAPEMIRFLEDQGMQFEYPDGWSDYYDDRDGGQPRGRSLTAAPYDLRNLGPWADKLARYMPFNGIPFPSLPLIRMLMFKKTFYAKAIMARLAFAMAKNKPPMRRHLLLGRKFQARLQIPGGRLTGNQTAKRMPVAITLRIIENPWCAAPCSPDPRAGASPGIRVVRRFGQPRDCPKT